MFDKEMFYLWLFIGPFIGFFLLWFVEEFFFARFVLILISVIIGGPILWTLLFVIYFKEIIECLKYYCSR